MIGYLRGDAARRKTAGARPSLCNDTGVMNNQLEFMRGSGVSRRKFRHNKMVD
jgi:hypothetical protein